MKQKNKKQKSLFSGAHQSGSMFDLLDNSIVTKVLQGEPEGQCTQLRHRLAGSQTCCQRLRHKAQRHRAVSHLETDKNTGHEELDRIQLTLIKLSNGC